MTTETKTYNGWTNYETWLVSLWLDNDEGTYTETREMTQAIHNDEDKAGDGTYELAGRLREYVENLPEYVEATEHASFVADLLTAAMSEVNWAEIAENYLSEIG